jgi:hypothetical protein
MRLTANRSLWSRLCNGLLLLTAAAAGLAAGGTRWKAGPQARKPAPQVPGYSAVALCAGTAQPEGARK